MTPLLSALLVAASVSSASAEAKAPRTPSGFTPQDTAGLPNRCPAERTYLDLASPQWMIHASPAAADADAQAAEALIRLPDPDSPTLSSYLIKKTDYYRRRREVQAKIEARLASLPEAERAQGLRNYAYTLLYLGEFSKIVEHFGPKGPAERPADGIVAFALAQAYFRLGRHAESLRYSKQAYKLLPEKVMDTRWQVMLAELGLHGKDLLSRGSTAYYDLRHVKALFPSRDWSALPFELVTDELGVEKWSGTGAFSFADLDGDGWDDLVMQRKDFPPLVYRNKQGAGFESVPEPEAEGRWCNQLTETVVDVDNDGLPDLHRQCCNYDGPGPSTLLKNLGGFRFQDVTRKSKLDYRVSGMLNAWADYDLDGRLDTVVTDHWGPVRLYRNGADGTFTDVTAKAGVITQGAPPKAGPGEKSIDEQELVSAGAVGCAWGDYDGDRYPDLSCNGWDWTKLFHNEGDGTFADVTAKAGLGDGKGVKGYNAFWLDYDNDGRLDLYMGRYVVNSGDRWGFGPRCTCSNLISKGGFSEREWAGAGTIFRNNGDGTFTNMVKKTRFLPIGVMGVNAADWDNDGDVDVVMGTGGPYMQQAEPYLFYENNGDGTFALRTPFTMGALWGKGHGAAFADYDHDGDLDLALNNGGAFSGDVWPSLLLRNRGRPGRHWLSVSLKGAKGTNAQGVGAQVELWAGPLHGLQELQAGGRFSATNSLSLHFGLGRHKQVDRLVVRWPSGAKTVTELKGLDADQAIEISEADGTYRKLWGAAIKSGSGAPARVLGLVPRQP
jgi:hypothetical protein